MENQPLATINLNIGLGDNNPKLVIYSEDNVPELINKLIRDYNLPEKVYDIILQRVNQELPKIMQIKPKLQQINPKKPNIQKEKSVSPLGHRKTYTTNLDNSRLKENTKENNKNYNNQTKDHNKKEVRKSLSPMGRTSNGPTFKKIELRPSKSPRKVQNQIKKSSKPIKIMDLNTKMQKLFRHLTKSNPPNVAILSPEHINVKGLDKNLLNELQTFFNNFQEWQFDCLDANYFMLKVEQLGFKMKLGKKEYEYSYTD